MAQFSVVTFVIMVILLLVMSLVLIELLNNNIDLLREHSAAIASGVPIEESDPFSIASVSHQVNNLKWITLGAMGGAFLYLYATLVYIVWEGWRTIVKQRTGLEAANAELEARVSERAEQLREAWDLGRRRLDAFRTAAGRLALEEDPERALQDLVSLSRDLAGARYGVLTLLDTVGTPGRFVTSGFSPDQRSRMRASPNQIEELGLTMDGPEKIVVGDDTRHLTAHGFQPGHAPLKSFLGAPVTVNGRTSGAFYLMEKEEAFTTEDETLLGLFAMLAGVHLENVELFEEVMRERRTLATIQGSMTEGLVVLDPRGQVMYLNQTAERLWGLVANDVRGKHIRDVFCPGALELEPPEALQNLIDVVEAADNSPKTIEVTLDKPQRRYLEVTAFSIPSASDKSMTGLLARDVTQQRELRERQYNFVSIASHELRTPMTTILGFTELLLKRDLPESSRREWLERIYQSSKALSAIVDDMLNISRIQSGKLALSLELLQLQDVVNEVLAGIRPETTVHEFIVSIPEDTPKVVADREKLAQVLINFLTNAIKYSPKGGPVTISARHDRDRERVVVEVADQGIGIAPEEQENLFSAFHRIIRPETATIKGTGLGLSIVKGLVQMMKGEVWAKSEMDKGSRFFFSIPTRRVDAR